MFIDPKIQLLWNLGHFFNPKVKDGRNVTQDLLHLLSFNDNVVQQALLSLQDMGQHVLKNLGRNRDADGELDEFTKLLFVAPRCGEPDYYLPGKVGSGSWPEPCQKAGVTYSLDRSGMPSKFNSTWDEQVLKPVIEDYANIGLKLIPGTGQANIRISFRSFVGSTIGLSQFNSGSCSDSVFCTISTSYSPNEATEADLLKHEMGHCNGLSHISGNGTMNPYIINRDVFYKWTPNDPSWNTLVRYFGGEPIGPPAPVEPKVSLVSYPSSVDLIEVDIKKQELRTKLNGTLINTYVLLSNKII